MKNDIALEQKFWFIIKGISFALLIFLPQILLEQNWKSLHVALIQTGLIIILAL